MIDSLERYRMLVEPNPERYTDRSGLFEILESAYIQLCNSDPWFNAYTDYHYFNVVREHEIKISKQLDLDGGEVWFSAVLLYCYRDRGEFEIHRIDYEEGKETVREETLKYEFGPGTFSIVYNYLKDWFSEILIRVKEYKPNKYENE